MKPLRAPFRSGGEQPKSLGLAVRKWVHRGIAPSEVKGMTHRSGGDRMAFGRGAHGSVASRRRVAAPFSGLVTVIAPILGRSRKCFRLGAYAAPGRTGRRIVDSACRHHRGSSASASSSLATSSRTEMTLPIQSSQRRAILEPTGLAWVPSPGHELGDVRVWFDFGANGRVVAGTFTYTPVDRSAEGSS